MMAGAFSVSGWGKTTLERDYLVRMLLKSPSELTRIGMPNIASEYKRALVVDPPTGNAPDGQYPGKLFEDVGAWRRTPPEQRTKISRFESPDIVELAKLALDLRDCIVLVDELDEHLGNDVHFKKGGIVWKLINKGRHWNCILVGSGRNFGSINNEMRRNTLWAWFGGMSELADERAVARKLGLSYDAFKAIGVEQYQFIEYQGEGRPAPLVEFPDGNRVVVRADGKARQR